MPVSRWKYAVILSSGRGQRFISDHDARVRPRVGARVAFRDKGMFIVVEREDPRGKNDGIGTLYVKEYA
jgi:hypothetical protein